MEVILMSKKCTFPKLGKRVQQLGRPKPKKKAMSSNERARVLNEWKRSIW